MMPLLADSAAFLLLTMPQIADSAAFLLLMMPLIANSAAFMLLLPQHIADAVAFLLLLDFSGDFRVQMSRFRYQKVATTSEKRWQKKLIYKGRYLGKKSSLSW